MSISHRTQNQLFGCVDVVLIAGCLPRRTLVAAFTLWRLRPISLGTATHFRRPRRTKLSTRWRSLSAELATRRLRLWAGRLRVRHASRGRRASPAHHACPVRHPFPAALEDQTLHAVAVLVGGNRREKTAAAWADCPRVRHACRGRRASPAHHASPVRHPFPAALEDQTLHAVAVLVGGNRREKTAAAWADCPRVRHACRGRRASPAHHASPVRHPFPAAPEDQTLHAMAGLVGGIRHAATAAARSDRPRVRQTSRVHRGISGGPGGPSSRLRGGPARRSSSGRAT